MNKNKFQVFDTTTHTYENTLYQAFLENKSNDSYEMNDNVKKSLYLFGDYPVATEAFPINEIKEHHPILISGCSMTNQGWWNVELCDKIQMSHNNIAWPGDSTIGQIKKIFWYIKEVGTPEYIFALFPSFDRFPIPSNYKWFDPAFNKMPDDSYIKNTHIEGYSEKHKYFKIPYDPTFALPLDLSHYYSALMINVLSEYCKSNKINFVWGTWDQRQYEILDQVRKENPGYYQEMIDMEAGSWEIDFENKLSYYINKETSQKVLCHINEKNSKHPGYFDFGSDIHSSGPDYAHFGFHRHLHIADAFYLYYLENWKNK